MKRTTQLIVSAFIMASCSLASASLTNAVFTSDLNLSSKWTWYPQKGGEDFSGMSMLAQQYGAGTATGTIFSDTVLDPTLLRGNDVFNETTFAWTGYEVVISMPQTFTISAVTVGTPGGWSWVATQPTLNGSQYTGRIDFSGGPAIAIGDEFDFSYKVSFLGSLQYSICEVFTPIPEPSALSLAGLGLLLLGRFAWRRSR